MAKENDGPVIGNTSVSKALNSSSTSKRDPSCKPVMKSLIEINDNKAGMEGLDKEKINAIILEATKDTPYYNHQMEHDQKVDEQIEEMHLQWSAFSDAEKIEHEKLMDAEIERYQPEARDMTQIIVHIDMDMFFAAIEIRDNPALADKPIAVGSMAMITTSNYVARKFGVRSAMTGFIGKKLCPDLMLIPVDYAKYLHESDRIMQIIRRYSLNIDVVGTDEAYVNLTEYVLQRYTSMTGETDLVSYNPETYERILKKEVWDLAFEVVHEIRERIYESLQLTASAGISINSTLAKICSDMNKPNGQFMVPGLSYREINDFIWQVPIRKVPNIGPVSEKILKSFGVDTVKDLYDQRAMISLLFKSNSIDFYIRAMFGMGSTMLSFDQKSIKSKGTSITIYATNDKSELFQVLEYLVNHLVKQLILENICGKTICLWYKKDTFDSYTRQKTLNLPTNDRSVILEACKNLLRTEFINEPEMRIRNIGVSITSLHFRDRSRVNKSPKQQTLDSYFAVKRRCGESSQSFSGIRSAKSGEKSAVTNSPRNRFLVCSLCRKMYDNFDQFEIHIKQHSEEEAPVNSAPDNQFQSTKSPPAVMYSPLHKSTYECPICSSIWSDLDSLNVHLDTCAHKT